MSGFVYFIAAETLDAVKIGFTGVHPKSRLRALQTGSPAPLKLLAFAPATQKEEGRLHDVFAPLHIHGEWFRLELKLKAFIEFLDAEPTEALTRLNFEHSISDVLYACRDFNPLQPKECTAEYAASAACAPLGDSW